LNELRLGLGLKISKDHVSDNCLYFNETAVISVFTGAICPPAGVDLGPVEWTLHIWRGLA